MSSEYDHECNLILTQTTAAAVNDLCNKYNIISLSQSAIKCYNFEFIELLFILKY